MLTERKPIPRDKRGLLPIPMYEFTLCHFQTKALQSFTRPGPCSPWSLKSLPRRIPNCHVSTQSICRMSVCQVWDQFRAKRQSMAADCSLLIACRVFLPPSSFLPRKPLIPGAELRRKGGRAGWAGRRLLSPMLGLLSLEDVFYSVNWIYVPTFLPETSNQHTSAVK